MKPGGLLLPLRGNPGVLPPKGDQGLLVRGQGMPARLCSAPIRGAEEGAGSLDPTPHTLTAFPLLCPHCSSIKVFLLLQLLHCGLRHLPWRVLGGRGTILGDLGSHGGAGSGRSLDINVKLSKIQSRRVFSSQPLLTGRVEDTHPPFGSPIVSSCSI